MRSAIMSKIIAAAVLLLLASATLWAQSPAAIDQVDTAQQRKTLEQSGEMLYDQGQAAPELYPHETEDVGPQSVLAPKAARTLFEGIADSQYYYTDNVFLDHSTRVPSGVMVSSAQFSLAPTPYKLGGGLSAPRVGFREQWYNFFQYYSQIPNPDLSSYDFSAQTAFVEERWTYQNWIFGAGFDYTRLLTLSGYRQFYSEYVPRWEITRIFRVNRQQAFSLGYQGYYHFTDASEITVLPESSFFDRLDQMFLATYTWEPCSNVVLQPYYAFRYTGYTSSVHRDDYLSTAGLGIYYFLGKYVSARAFVSYDQRYSSVTAADYHQFTSGGGLNFIIRF